MAFVAVTMQEIHGVPPAPFTYIMTRNADGSFAAHSTRAYGSQTPNMLWKAALASARTTCAGNVGFEQVIDPDTLKVRSSDNANANRAKSFRQYLFVAFEKPGSRTAKGFLMALRKVDGIYLDVICAASPQGTLLMQALLNRADEDNLTVTLGALPNVLTQYPKWGFQFRNSCNDAPVIVPSDLQARLNARVASKSVPSSLDAQWDRDWKELLLLLQQNQLNVVKMPPCDDPNLDSDEIASNYCGRDGQIMKRCKANSGTQFSEPVLEPMREPTLEAIQDMPEMPEMPAVEAPSPMPRIFAQIAEMWRAASPFGQASDRSEGLDDDASSVEPKKRRISDD